MLACGHINSSSRSSPMYLFSAFYKTGNQPFEICRIYVYEFHLIFITCLKCFNSWQSDQRMLKIRNGSQVQCIRLWEICCFKTGVLMAVELLVLREMKLEAQILLREDLIMLTVQ